MGNSLEKYLWIGGFFNPKLENELLKNGHVLMSSYKSQKNLFEGIEESGEIVFDTINSIRLNPFPKYKKLLIKKDQWAHKNTAIDRSVSYLNVKYLSIAFRTFKLKLEAAKWGKMNKHNTCYVFCFGMTSPFMKAAIEIKKKVDNCVLILINPDLPQYMTLQSSKFKQLLKQLDWSWMKKKICLFDKHILYSKHMAEYLKLPESSTIVIEGSIDQKQIIPLIKEQSNKTRVVYTGIVGKMYGVDKLVDAFQYLDNTFELRLFGVGDYEDNLRLISQLDSRIKYLGYISERNKLLQEQKNADILISLINPNDEVSKYSFPSKILEYLLSKNIVIATRTLGIPDDYFKFIIPLNQVTSIEIANAIMQAKSLSIEERITITEGGFKFVFETKNNVVQGAKILDFVRKKNGK